MPLTCSSIQRYPCCSSTSASCLSPDLTMRALKEHMNDIGGQVLQQPLIMGNEDQGAIGAAQAVDANGDDSQRIDILARVRFRPGSRAWGRARPSA